MKQNFPNGKALMQQLVTFSFGYSHKLLLQLTSMYPQVVILMKIKYWLLNHHLIDSLKQY